MSIKDVARACEQVGFTGNGLVTMVAVGIAESGCDANATNDTRRFTERRADGRWYDPHSGQALPLGHWPEWSIGWAQINILYHSHWTEEECRDYRRAAEIAYELSGGGDHFTDWSGYRVLTGDHYAQAAAAVHALHQVEQPTPTGPRSVYLGHDLAVSALVAAAGLVHGGDDVYIEENGPEGLLLVAFLPRATLDAEWRHVGQLL